MYLVWITVCVTVVWCAYAYSWWRGRRARTLCANLPAWPQLPFLGNVHQFYGGPEVIFKRITEMSEISERCNSMFRLWFGPQFVLFMYKPEDVRAVTNAFIEKPYYYTFGRMWLGDGLVTGPASVWKRNIKNLAATFTGSVIDNFQDIFNYQASKLVNNFKSEVGQPPFDAMKKYLAYTTLESICQTALGVPDISQSIITSEYYEAFTRTLKLIIDRGFNLCLHPEFIYKLTPGYQEMRKTVKVLHNVSNTVIAQRRKEFNELKQSGKIKTEKRSKFRPFLDLLLELSEDDPLLTDEQIRAEVDTVIVGGQETTATTLTFTMLLLGSHTRVQDKLYQEMKEIFGDSKRPVEKEDLSRMPYCEAVLCESLRLYPVIPGVMRYADTDLKLESGQIIPAGTVCVVNSWGAGRSQRLWGPDAHVFRPERWLDKPAIHPASFLAFSYGRRSCIGKRYAFAFLKTVLAHCSRELVFVSEAEKLKLKFDIALRPIEGHLVEVQLRNQ